MIEVRPFNPNSATPAEWAACMSFGAPATRKTRPTSLFPRTRSSSAKLAIAGPCTRTALVRLGGRRNRRHHWLRLFAASEPPGTRDDYAAYLHGWCRVRTHRRGRGLLRICSGPCAISCTSGTSPSQHSRRRFPTATHFSLRSAAPLSMNRSRAAPRPPMWIGPCWPAGAMRPFRKMRSSPGRFARSRAAQEDRKPDTAIRSAKCRPPLGELDIPPIHLEVPALTSLVRRTRPSRRRPHSDHARGG